MVLKRLLACRIPWCALSKKKEEPSAFSASKYCAMEWLIDDLPRPAGPKSQRMGAPSGSFAQSIMLPMISFLVPGKQAFKGSHPASGAYRNCSRMASDKIFRCFPRQS